MWRQKQEDPFVVAVAFGLVIALIVGVAIFNAAYPCRRYETRETTQTTCRTLTGGMTTCTTRPDSERVCVEREGW